MSDPITDSKPPFRRIPWPARDIAVDRRDDGSILMRSRVPLHSQHVEDIGTMVTAQPISAILL